MRHLLLALPLLLLPVPPAAQAQVYVNIGIHLPVYPQLQLVPGYPVYYAPEVQGNFFFYDGLYWVFEDDNWYYSSWYNGPWFIIGPEYVPVYLLRVPVRYYRRPPMYFTYWRVDAPPRWGDHWGPGWAQRRSGWDHWDRAKAPAPAPLPDYQRKYPQSRYPQFAVQDRIRNDHYRYQPRNPTVRAQLAAPPPPASPQRPDNRPLQREEVRRPDRVEPAPMPRQDRPGPRFDERAAPPQQVAPREPDGVRRPERAERPPMPVERNEPRFDRREAQPPMRPFEPEQRRPEAPERRAAPEPRQQPQWQSPRQPDFQPRQPPQQQQQPTRAEPMNRGQDREQPGQRRFEEERGRGGNGRGDERRNRD